MDSMSDINSKGMKEEWITPIIDKMTECGQHVFQILSKFPVGYKAFRFPKNVWLGTSITRDGEIYRVHQLRDAANGNLCFVSIEPIQERIKHWFIKSEIDWIIVGLETGHRKNKIIPHKDWIDSLIQNARTEAIPIFIKDNIVELLGNEYHIEEFPFFLGDKMDFSSLGIVGVEAVGSGLVGFILGYGIKKIVKILFYAVAIIAAIIFLPVAYVAYKYPGVIIINWTELFNALGDQANSTVNYLSSTSTSVLQMFPSASAFVVCLLVGFSKG